MALRTGLDNVVTAEPGMGIRDRQNIVSPMAVVAFGGRKVAQFGDLPMKGLKIAGCNFLVTTPTLIHDMEAKIRQISSFDRMGGVALTAHRQLLFRMGHFR